MAASDEALWQRTVKIASVVGLYWFVSISMVFLNKHLLSNVSVCNQKVFLNAMCCFYQLGKWP
eukprot:m.182995 g.182995  ORF g.182995 m.182995 type:complete len:63 (+) comp16891_c0_seq6:33-221(+)